MAKKVKKELSEDAKVGQIEKWAVALGLDAKETSAVMTEKYGPYAHEIMQKAMMKPSVLMSEVGGKASGSKGAVDYMVKHILSDEELAKVVHKTPQQVQAEMAEYRVAHPIAEETIEQKEFRERQEKFNQHFNDEMERRSEGKAQVVDPSKVDITKMTLEDYAKYCDPKDKPAANYKALVDEAYKDFVKGEGEVSQLYLDPIGLPTIGVGHLVLSGKYIQKPEQVKNLQDRYASMPLVDANGKPLSQAQKIADFQKIKTAYQKRSLKTEKNLPHCVTNLPTGRLTKAGMRQVFEKDFKEKYDRTKKVVPNIDDMPLPVQLAVLHTAFACGNVDNFKSIDVNDPASLMAAVTKQRDNNQTSTGERQAINEANDTIRVAQNNYREDMELQEQRREERRKLREITESESLQPKMPWGKQPEFSPMQIVLRETGGRNG